MTGQGIELAHGAAMPAPQGGALPTGLEWDALMRMADTLASSALVPYKLRGKPGDVAVILLAAREYGVPPLMALTKLPVVNGTPAPMGELMVALVLRAGHRITSTVYNEDGTLYAGGALTKGTYAACVSRRHGEDDDHELRFTLEEALTAGLVDRLVDGRTIARVTKQRNGQTVEERTPWEQYPSNMLRWRAVANACRLRFPDVLMGLSYLPEELGAYVDAEGRPVDPPEDGPAAPRTRTAPEAGKSLEQRTAEEWAPRIVAQPYAPEFYEQLITQASDGGFADHVVPHPARTDNEPAELTIRQLIELYADKAAGIVSAEVVEDEPSESAEDPDGKAPEDHEEAATAPPAAQEPPAAPTPPETPAEDVSEPQEVSSAPTTTATPPGLTAEDLAIVALEESDTEVLKVAWQDAKRLELVGHDVGHHLDARDREVLGVPSDLAEVKLGALLFEVVKYVKAQGAAVRAPMEADPSDPDDPWARDQLEPGEDPPAGWL